MATAVGLYRYPAADVSVPHFSSLTVFFPMWNEEEYIQRAVDAAREACEALIDAGEIGDYEVLVIDDASTDATGGSPTSWPPPTPASASCTTRRTASWAAR